MSLFSQHALQIEGAAVRLPSLTPGVHCGAASSSRLFDTPRRARQSVAQFGFWRCAVAAISLALVGFIFGVLFVPQLFRWIFLVYTTVAPQQGDFLGPPRRRLLWATPFALFMHPAPYFLLGILWLAVRAAMGRIPYPWPAILAGFCAGAVFNGLASVLRFARLRRSRLTGRRG